MSKAIEEYNLTAVIKRLLWEFELYWEFMCTSENNDKNKTNLYSTPYPLPPQLPFS